MNLCRTCGEDFATVTAFDEHRTGVHDYTFAEGMAMTPPVEDGRRCFGVDELVRFGWSRKPSGLWHYPKDWVMQSRRWDHTIPDAESMEQTG